MWFSLLILLSSGSVLRFVNGELEESISLQEQKNLEDANKVTIEITNNLRSYNDGPVDNLYTLSLYDTVSASIGIREKNSSPKKIVQWAMWEINREKDPDALNECTLSQVYDYGNEAIFLCEHPGIYRIYAFEPKEYPWGEIKKDRSIKNADDLNPLTSTNTNNNTTSAKSRKLWISILQKVPFRFKEPFSDSEEPQIEKNKSVSAIERFKAYKEQRQNESEFASESDPISVTVLDYCFYWNYKILQTNATGYMYTDVQDSSSNYIEYQVQVWIIEPRSVLRDEINHHGGKTLISEYSEILTTKFQAKGVYPCVKKAHGAIQIIGEVEWVPAGKGGNVDVDALDGSHWLIKIRLHTDTIISTFVDVSFTLSSRQRASLYNCFVGDTRILLNFRKFEFMQPEKTSLQKLDLSVSKIGVVRKQSIEKKFNYLYGHGVSWVGPEASRLYEPGSLRTDLIIIPNQCGAQEFAAVGGGRLTIVRSLLEKNEDIVNVYFPDVGVMDIPEYDYVKQESRHIDYLPATDVAFTPTHLVTLMLDSAVYLHPTSLIKKGIGYVTSTKKYFIDKLVKRAWCANTGYLTHNMYIPAFSKKGNIILVQIYPIENSTRVKVQPPPDKCLDAVKEFPSDESDEKLRDEAKIHLHEKVPQSDEVGRLITPPPVEPPEPPRKNFDGLTTYLANKGEMLDEVDPHFSDVFSNPATKRLGRDYTNYNLAIVYVVEQKGDKAKAELIKNGLITAGEKEIVDINLLDIKFTAQEKRFLVATQLTPPDSSDLNTTGLSTIFKSRKLIVAITTVNVVDLPVRIVHTTEDVEEELESKSHFPGSLLVRRNVFKLPRAYTLSPDDYIEGDEDVQFPLILYALNTALPTYIISLGNVYVYASLDGRFAKPLSYIKRKIIFDKKGKVSSDDATPNFAEDGNDKETRLHDLVVTQHGGLSILWRKPMRKINDDPKNKNSANNLESQSIAIGSVFVNVALREVKPFAQKSRIFQMVTPDDQIIYGKFVLIDRARYPECNNTDAVPVAPCVVQCDDKGDKKDCGGGKLCTTEKKGNNSGFSQDCVSWKPMEKPNQNYTNTVQLLRQKNAGLVHDHDFRFPLKNCNETFKTPGCFYNIPECIRDLEGKLNKSVKNCVGREPIHVSVYNIKDMEFISTPYNSLLKGSLDYDDTKKEPEEKNDVDKNKKEVVCPYSHFELTHTPFDYAEVGYSTRITAEVSYFGKNIPPEADLLIEFEDVLGIKVDINYRLSIERDQTTVRKSVDIDFQMSESDLRNMATKHAKYTGPDQFNQQDNARVFSITFRPSIVNLHCNTADLLKTLQINVGCHPFTAMRLIHEATPLNKIQVVDGGDKNKENSWARYGNYLSVPRKEIHHRQRTKFKCSGSEKNKVDNTTNCIIPYAQLYGSNVFQISWRDPIYPKFEQFLTRTSRRVTGNVIIYDLLGDSVYLNLTRLKARCYNNGEHWYKKLLEQQVHLGKTTNISVHEDIYKWYKDCHDQSELRETPLMLANISFRLQNLTNKNNIKFYRHPNPRNKIYIFRAAVVNTYYNKYTFCKNLDTYFLVRITGIPTPRKALEWWFYIIMGVGILAVLAFTYIHFSFSFAWKGDIAPVPVELTKEDARQGYDDDDILDEEYLRDEEHIEFDFTQRVQPNNLFTRFADRVYAITKWKNKAVEEVEKKHEEKAK